jgi:diaminohydroxyphosphoribosylaminopyrimidine deaminase / 5-amino-6-(5-phosphoribosylamino)uracil reductase
VVAGMVDPDSRVSGGGLNFLRSHNISVTVGVQRQACEDINAPFVLVGYMTMLYL